MILKITKVFRTPMKIIIKALLILLFAQEDGNDLPKKYNIPLHV